MEYGSSIGMHILPWLMMVTVLIAVRTGNLRDGQARRADERMRLRAGLIAELRALRTAYSVNAGLGPEGPVAMSGRPYFTMYRGNMQRLLLLTEVEVTAVVRAHAAAEALDSALALHARLEKHRGSAASETVVSLDLRRMHRAARGNGRIALQVLLEAASAEPARRRWYERLWAMAWRRRAAEPAAPAASAEVVRLPPPAARAR